MPPACRFDQPTLVAIGSSERTFSITKQLGFDEIVRNRRAVDTRERKLSARTLKVKRHRNQLFARPRLAFDQHRGVRRRGSADDGVDLPHLRITSDDPEIVAIA